ncbi:MAG: hypothetical protein MUE44_13790 [Oscillatoriaceae cyanobacterium Prado104]|nr:hypothetical protein [Oscillatoriaceae cyanobacterium Prado104]
MQSVSAGEIASFQESFLRAVVAAVVSAEIAFKEAEALSARRLQELLQQEESERQKLEAEERNRNLESGMQISAGDVLLFGYANGSKIDTLSGMAGRFYHPGLPKTLDALKDVPEGTALPGAAGLRIDFAGQPVLQTDAEGTVVVNKFIGANFEADYFTSFFKVRSAPPLSEEPRRIIQGLKQSDRAVVSPVKEGLRGNGRQNQSAARPANRAANPARSVAVSLKPSQSKSSQHPQSQFDRSKSFQHPQSRSSQNSQLSQPQNSQLSQPQNPQLFQSKNSHLSQHQNSQLLQSQTSQLSQHKPLGSDAKSRYVAERLVEFSSAVGKPVEIRGTRYVWKATPDGRCRIDDPNRGCLLADDGCGNFRSRMTEADLEHFEKALPELMKMKPIPARPYESKQPKKSQLEI